MRTAKARAGIQSIEVGAPLLTALIEAAGPMTLTALAKTAAMPPSKAHKYLASFVRVGLVTQSTETGRYDLGPLAVECGFAALRRVNVADIAQSTLDDLRDRLDLTVSLTVWGSHGPTIVRDAKTRQPISLVVQLGLVLPLLTSSNGRIFAAYLDRRLTREMIAAELKARDGAAAKAGLRRLADVERLLAEVRRRGLATAPGTVQPGVIGISAPVFDHSGTVAAALTLVGVEEAVELGRRGRAVPALQEAAGRLSRQLGAPAR
jgi:DNA-binding IclR family transcriptional regulator